MIYGHGKEYAITRTFIYYLSKHSGNCTCHMIWHSTILRSAHTMSDQRANISLYDPSVCYLRCRQWLRVWVLHSGVSEDSDPLWRHFVCLWV